MKNSSTPCPSPAFHRHHSSEVPFAVGVPAVLWQIIFFYLPLLLLICTSFIEMTEAGELRGFTFSKIQSFFSPVYLRVIVNSLSLALLNSILCFFIGYPLAYYIAFRGKKKKNFLLFLLIIPFWTNFLLHVYAWCFVLERKGFLNTLLHSLGLIQEPLHFLNSLFAIAIMMLYYYLPFMVLSIYSSLEKFDYKLIEASLDLGATWLQTLRQIVLPLSLNGIRTGFFLVFIPSFSEFATQELMGGDKWMFAGNVISHFILGDETGSLGAAFTVVSCCVLLLFTFFLYSFLGKLISPKACHVLEK